MVLVLVVMILNLVTLEILNTHLVEAENTHLTAVSINTLRIR